LCNTLMCTSLSMAYYCIAFLRSAELHECMYFGAANLSASAEPRCTTQLSCTLLLTDVEVSSATENCQDNSSTQWLLGRAPTRECPRRRTWSGCGQDLGSCADLDGIPQRRAGAVHLQAALGSRKQRRVLQRRPNHRLHSNQDTCCIDPIDSPALSIGAATTALAHAASRSTTCSAERCLHGAGHLATDVLCMHICTAAARRQ
jgi:hypothetical protein